MCSSAGICRIACVCALSTVIAVVSSSTLRAQGIEDVRPVPDCSGCVVDFDSVAVLGTTEGNGTIRGSPSSIVVDEKGRFVVAQRVPNEPAKVYGPDGSFRGAIGKVGDGPGEYRSIQALSVDADGIYLYDEGTQRISAVDHDLDFQRSIPLRGSGLWSGLALSSDLHVVNMLVFDGAATGYALHLVNGAGDIIRSFEAYDASSRDPKAHLRHLFRDGDGKGFWSVPLFGRVTLRRYSSGGDLLTEWSASPAPGDELPMSYGNPDEDRVPTRQILAAWQDDGLVWVVSSIPGPRWREGLTQAADELHGSSFRPTDLGLIFDGAVEVFDVESGELFAARYSDQLPVEKPIGPGIAARMTTDEFGWVYLHVQRARLSHSNSP